MHCKKFCTKKVKYQDKTVLTKTEKDVNKKTKELAETIRAQRQVEMQNGTFGFGDIEKLKGSFTTFLLKVSEDRNTSDGNYGNWDGMIKHFKTFIPSDISFFIERLKFCFCKFISAASSL